MEESAASPSPPAPDVESARAPVSRRFALLRGAAALVVLALIGGTLFFLSSRTRPHSAGSGTGPLDSRTPVVGQPAPNFALPDLDGRVVRLSDLRGKVVLVNFWATWCIPCRAELPDMTQVYREHRDRGFMILGVNEQESLHDISAFADQIGGLPPVLLDQDGAVKVQYGLKGLPDSFIIDRQGIVRGVSYGPLSQQDILKYIDTTQQGALLK